MRSRIRWAAVVVILAVLLAGCQKIKEEAHSAKASYALEKIAATGFTRMTLQPKAAERLAIKSAPVRAIQTARGTRKAIAYSAIIYGTKGETWAYTSPAPYVFLREVISVDFIDGDMAYLSSGPAAGTAIVTVGAAELYGLENGFGK